MIIEKYETCISLGWFCGVASSMARYGLRSHSGPFDWYFSDFESVLKVMETDFADFMAKENLFVDNTDRKIFHDKKYGFTCNHDVKVDFNREYDIIYQKYMKKVRQFRCDIEKPTCFIRAVRSEKELIFIEKKRDYIYEIIKRKHRDSEIIFLLLNNMKELPDSFLWFRLGREYYFGKNVTMRTMFDSSKEFLECAKRILPEEIIKHNKEFDKKHLSADMKIMTMMAKLNNYNIETILVEHYHDLEQGLLLWGAGNYGISILQYLIENGKVDVKGIIDNDQKKVGSVYEGIPVISFSDIIYDNQNIFIAVGERAYADEIEKQITENYSEMKTLKLIELVDLLEKKYNCVF